MQFLFRVIGFGLLLTPVLATGALAESSLDQIPVLIKSLDNANVRYGASVALAKLGPKAVSALRKSLASQKGDVPVWSAFTLGQIGPVAQSAVGDLIKALSSSDDVLRAAAAQALGKIGAAAAVDPLANALADTNQDVRRRAVVALGQIGPSAKNATEKLIGALSDSQLRTLARKALTQIDAAVKPLLNSLDNDKIRIDVAVVVLQVDPKAAKRAGLDKATDADLPALRLVLNDLTRAPADRTAAATALAAIGKHGVLVLIAAFEDEQIAHTAAQAFAKTGAAAVSALIDALKHKKPEVRSTAADALGHIGPAASAAAPHLIRMLKNDDDRDVRYRAVRALHTFEKKAKPAIPTLIEIINNARESESTRQWAIKTLIVTLPDTHDVVVKALIAASKDKGNYGVSQLARQQVRKIDLKASEAAGVK